MTTLGGAVCIRNGYALDFCWEEAVNSLLPVCDEVCVCVSPGDDMTEDVARAWAAREPKINLCIYPWPEPKGDPDFWVKWLNYAREHLKSEWHFQLDADEVLHEKSYEEIRRFIEAPAGTTRAGIVTRWNFWRDHLHTIPDGVCLGKHVVRLSPSNLWLASDGAHPQGEQAASMAVATGIEIFHYGFLRKPSAFFKKERLLQNYFFDTYDKRLEDVEQTAGNWMHEVRDVGWNQHPDPWSGTHPKIMTGWLKERGYEI